MTQVKKGQEPSDEVQPACYFELLCEDFMETEGQDTPVMDPVKLIDGGLIKVKKVQETSDEVQPFYEFEPLCEEFSETELQYPLMLVDVRSTDPI